MLTFTFDFSTLFAFLLGMLSGAIILSLLYLLFALISLKRKSYIIKTEVKNLSEEEVQGMIKRTQDKYLLDKECDGEDIKEGAFKRNILYLVEDIAQKFYPKSKHPLGELTLDELILLDKYIVKRVEELVDRPAVRIIKRMKLNTLIKVSKAKKKVENNAIVKTADKIKVNKITKYVSMAFKAINPLYWFKKLVIDNVVDKMLERISLLIISIAGTETYKVYSKQAFTKQDEEFEQLVNELDQSGHEINESIEKTDKK